jgi:flagellar biosynthesis regulator FlbT
MQGMAFDRDKIYQQAQTAIKENNLFFIDDIVAWLPCGKSTFYEMFSAESEEMNSLKELLGQNKIRTKSAIRAKLYKSPKAAELLALYRLICTPEERQMLNQNYIELTGKDGKDLLPKIEIEVINGEG